MTRKWQRWCVALVLCSMPLAGTAHAGAAQERSPALTAAQLQQKLRHPISIPEFAPTTPCREALGFIAERSGITILVDTQAFKDELQINEPEQQPVRLPELNQVRLRWILDQLAGQVGGTAVQEGNIVWIAPPCRARQRLLRQSIELDFDRTELQSALNAVAEQTGCSIALDSARARDASKSAVTVKLRGIALEDAVRTLADMTGLKAILVGDLFYVTTEEHAEQLMAEQKRQQQEQRELKSAKANQA